MSYLLLPARAVLLGLLIFGLSGCGGGDDDAAADTTQNGAPERGATLGEPSAGAAPTGTTAGADDSRFDPHDIDNALRWWIARTREFGEAQRSGNQLRIDAARQEFDAHRASLVGQQIRYTFSVHTPSVGGALATGDAISSQGVHIAILHENDHGAIRVGSRTDASGRPHTESTPILVRTGQGIDEATLMQLSNRSTFVASARIVDTTWLGATFMRPPTLVLFVDDVQVEQVNP